MPTRNKRNSFEPAHFRVQSFGLQANPRLPIVSLSLTQNPLPEPESSFEPAAAQQPPPRDPVWTGWDVAMIAVVAVLGIFVFGSLIGIGFAAIHHGLPRNSAMALRLILAAQVLSYLLVLWFMHHLVVKHYHVDFDQAVHWHSPSGNWYRWLAAGIMLAFAVQLFSMLLPIPRTLPIDRYFQTRGAAYMMAIFGISMAPLVEELFFRGFLYPVLARRLGIAGGVVLTAMAFAFMHASQLASAWAPLLILFIVGAAFTIVRVVTGSVARTFLMHVGYNLTLFTLLYIATDRFQHMEKLLQR